MVVIPRSKRQPRRWQVQDDQRPWTTNSERTWHFQKRAARVRETRERFFWLAKEAKIPALSKIDVTAVPLVKNRRSMQDVGACFPAVKAAIDGLVDAGVIPDDDAEHLDKLTFYAPRVGDVEGLRLVVMEAPCPS